VGPSKVPARRSLHALAPAWGCVRIRKALPRDPAVDAYLASRRGVPGDTARWLAEICRATIPGCTEAVWHGSPKFCLADGTVVAYVATYTNHADLGLIQGALLADPDGLLEGTGKGLRHVKVAAPSAVPKAKLVRLLRAAVRRAAT
jgi:hypothetical protein